MQRRPLRTLFAHSDPLRYLLFAIVQSLSLIRVYFVLRKFRRAVSCTSQLNVVIIIGFAYLKLGRKPVHAGRVHRRHTRLVPGLLLAELAKERLINLYIYVLVDDPRARCQLGLAAVPLSAPDFHLHRPLAPVRLPLPRELVHVPSVHLAFHLQPPVLDRLPTPNQNGVHRRVAALLVDDGADIDWLILEFVLLREVQRCLIPPSRCLERGCVLVQSIAVVGVFIGVAVVKFRRANGCARHHVAVSGDFLVLQLLILHEYVLLFVIIAIVKSHYLVLILRGKVLSLGCILLSRCIGAFFRLQH